MLDLQLLRNDLTAVAQKLATRGFDFPAAQFEALESQRKALQIQTEELQAQRNSVSKQIGALKAQGKHDEAQTAMSTVSELKTQLEQTESAYQNIQTELDNLLLGVPNLPNDSAPIGIDETQNVEVRRFGTPREFSFPIKDQVELGEMLGLDFEKASELSGARFSLMKGKIARLHRALAQFMLDVHLSLIHI